MATVPEHEIERWSRPGGRAGSGEPPEAALAFGDGPRRSPRGQAVPVTDAVVVGVAIGEGA